MPARNSRRSARDEARASKLANLATTIPNFRELVEPAIEHTFERFAERRSAAANAIDNPLGALVATIRAGLRTGLDDETLGERIRAMTAQQVEVYRRVVEDGQVRGDFKLADDSRTIARSLVALEDAFGLYIIGGAPIVDEALEQILSFARLATGCTLCHGLHSPRA